MALLAGALSSPWLWKLRGPSFTALGEPQRSNECPIRMLLIVFGHSAAPQQTIATVVTHCWSESRRLLNTNYVVARTHSTDVVTSTRGIQLSETEHIFSWMKTSQDIIYRTMSVSIFVCEANLYDLMLFVHSFIHSFMHFDVKNSKNYRSDANHKPSLLQSVQLLHTNTLTH